MGSPRLRRLIADYEAILDEFTGHPHIVVVPTRGDPPEEYAVTYRVPGLVPGQNGGPPQIAAVHRASIMLTADYPRLKPRCEMLTPAYHPNFGSYICVGDHWAAGETIVDLIVKIGDMLQYRDYNVMSALNVPAARWTAANEHHLPIGNVELYAPEPEISFELLDDTPRPSDRPSAEPHPPADPSDDLDVTLE
jgi:ubiquitin-protein ligase